MRGPAHNKGIGFMVGERSETHTYFARNRWWRSREEFEAWRKEDQFRARARKNGYLGRYEEFRVLENQAKEALDTLKNRERWVKREMARLKKKHGLPPRSNRSHLKAAGERTKDPEIFALLNLMTNASTNDTEKIARIRLLFLEGKPPAEILYQTALMVGVNLRKKL